MKKKMYVVKNIDGDEVYYDSLIDALDSMAIELREFNTEDIEDGVDLVISMVLMTEDEIAELHEYNP